MPLIQPSYSLPNFLHTLFFSMVIITTALFLTSVNLQTILLQIRAYGACDCGQVNHPARQSALGTQARQRVAARPRAAGAALSTSTQVRICPRAAWTAPRAVPRVPHAVPRARLAHCGPRAARRAPRKSPSPHLNPSRRAGRSFGPSALQSVLSNALSNVCPPSSQRLPPDLRTTTGKQGQPAYPRLSPFRLSPTRRCKHAVVNPPP